MLNAGGPPPSGQTEFEAMLRRYLAKVAVRYAPVLIAGLAILLVLVLVPTTQPESQGTALGTGGRSTGSNGRTGTTEGAAGQSGVGQGGTSATATGAASGGGGGTSAGAPIGPGAVSTSGVSKGGVSCDGQDARQFTWSAHSPYCVAAFQGDNGGATAQGVTGDTITLTFRNPNSTQDQAIAAAAGNANVNYPAMLADMQTYIDFFNSQFELYGRKVVLKPYDGQGDYIDEDQGQNLAAAQADAVSSREMGAFGDVTFALGASQAYEEALANQHLMSFSSVAQPDSWFQQFAPYEWSVQGGGGTVGVQVAAEFVCRRMVGMPAIFAGDAPFKATNRVFGLIYPEVPTYTELANLYKQLMKQKCNQDIAATAAYKIDVASFPNQALSVIAQMNAAHVSTILCACDPIFPIFLSRAASGQAYHPEWATTSFGDPSGRLYDQSEWSHAYGAGLQFPDPKSTEAYNVYQLANPGHEPAEGSGSGGPPYFYVPYYQLLHVFEGLQAAGPNLTPDTFQQGMFSLPPSGDDPIGGKWVFGENVYDPISSFSLAWWDPNGTSEFDGQKGRWAACNGGQVYTIDNLDALGGPNQQLSCFGQ